MARARVLPVLVLGVVAACADEVRGPQSGDAVTVVLPVPQPAATGAATAMPAVPSAPEPVAPARGMELYVRHCAACHGEGGGGDGPSAPWLEPHPWNFAGGFFKFGSTVDGCASDADLRRTIATGVPGSSMPAFASLPAADLDDLVRAVRHLTLVATAAVVESADRERPRGEVLAIAQGLVAPGRPIELPPRPAGETDRTAAAKAFELKCLQCHGADGSGRGAPEGVQRDAFRFEIRPRDLTRDPLKGGASAQDIAHRLVRGIPGTPMPAAGLEAATLWAVVDHVMRLRVVAPPAAEVPLVAARSAGDLPATPDAAEWVPVAAAYRAQRPLRARDDAAGAIDVRVLHDGTRVAVRLGWHASSADAPGAAIRVARSGDSAFALADDASTRALTGRWCGLVATSTSPPPAGATPSSWAETDRGFRGVGASRDGATSLVFVGALPAGAVDAGALEICVATWAGVAPDGRPFEAVTDWQRVELAR